MRLLVLILAVFLSGYAQSKSDEIYIDKTSTASPPKPTTAVQKGEDDDGSGSAVVSDQSGSGGEGSGTDAPVVDVKVVSPSVSTPRKKTTIKTQKPTTMDNRVPEVKTKSKAAVPVKTEGTEKPTTEPDNTVDEDGPNMVAYGGTGDKKKVEDPEPNETSNSEGNVLTVEVGAAIVVGAVCAIILIAFLVYRLRKRDEGSYALTDGGYNDTYKLRGEGKEAFV